MAGKTIIASPNKRKTTLTQREVTGSNHGSKFPVDVLPLDARNEKFTGTQTVLNDSTATRVTLPEEATKVILKHTTASITVWLGADSSITASGNAVWPLETSEQLVLQVKKGNEVELYAIASSGTPTLYAIGGHKDV